MAATKQREVEHVPVVLSLTRPDTEVADDEADRAARLFKALSDPIRIRLVSLIRRSAGAEVCFCDIASEFDMPQPSLSHHLGVLVKAGILARQRRGTWSWYRLLPEPLQALEALLRPGGPLLDDPGRDDRCR